MEPEMDALEEQYLDQMKESESPQGWPLYKLLKKQYPDQMIETHTGDELQCEALIEWLKDHNINHLWLDNKALLESLESFLDEFNLQNWYDSLVTDMQKDAVREAIEKDKGAEGKEGTTGGGGKRKKSKKRKSKRKSKKKKSKKGKTRRKRR